MSDFREKLKSIFGAVGERRRAVVSAFIILALALSMFFVALFAPFCYNSDKDVLHITSVETDNASSGEQIFTVCETHRVEQSLFRLFEAATYLPDASALHSASLGIIEDKEEYEGARNRLRDLRKQYNEIVESAQNEALSLGISRDSEEYVDLLADKLSGVNLIALDMLETSFASDNTGSYETVYSGIVLGLIGATLNLAILVAAVTAVIAAIAVLVLKKHNVHGTLFMRMFAIISGVELLLCLFNPVLIPTACPLALACVAALTYFSTGLIFSLASPARAYAVATIACVSALTVTAFLSLAATPSLTLLINGLGGRYLSYAGTVGTVSYSRIEAMIATGLSVPYGAIKPSFALGSIIGAASLACAVVSLDRLYRETENVRLITAVFCAIAAVFGIAYVSTVAAVSGGLESDGMGVRYTVGACWYVNFAFMLAASALIIAIETAVRKGKLSRSAEGAGNTASIDDVKPAEYSDAASEDCIDSESNDRSDRT